MITQSLQNTATVERLRSILAGHQEDVAKTTAERIEAARRGLARRPYFIVVPLSQLTGGGVLLNNNPINFRAPKEGVPRALEVLGAMSDAMKSTALFNVMRRTGLPRNVTEEGLFSTPQRALLLAGDMNAGANRIGPAEWFNWPEPYPLRKGESLHLVAQGDAAAPDMSNCFVVFRSELVFEDGTSQAEFDDNELREITEQIGDTDPRTGIFTIPIDYTSVPSYTQNTFPDIGEWALLLGFASGTAAASNTFLQWSTIDITDPRGNPWSNEPLPITALMSLLFDTSNTQLFYRSLVTPYLLAPGRNNLIQFTLAKRAATGGGAYPPNMVADTVGNIIGVYRTL